MADLISYGAAGWTGDKGYRAFEMPYQPDAHGIPSPTTVGLRLKMLRKARHMSKCKVERATGLCRNTIHAFETGMRYPNLYTLLTLCELFGVTPNDIIWK